MINKFISTLDTSKISPKRKKSLDIIINELKKYSNKRVDLNFICTHNSRRSQFSQVWSNLFSNFYNHHNINSFSGGTQVTGVYKSVIEVLIGVGLIIKKNKRNDVNPKYSIKHIDKSESFKIYSKLYNCKSNPSKDFIAIMNCSSADVACPYVSGSIKRILLPYDDPKIFDGSTYEIKKYNKTNIEIASSMKYLHMNI